MTFSVLVSTSEAVLAGTIDFCSEEKAILDASERLSGILPF